MGGMTAREMSERGLGVALLEEHSEPGKFDKCTALVSATGLDAIGVDFRKTVLHEIHGAVLHAPNVSFTVTRKKPVAYVLNRQQFDTKCVDEAVKAGAELFLDSRVSSLSQTSDRCSVEAGKRKFESELVAGCDGLTSFTARAGNFPTFRRFVSAWEAEYSFPQEPLDKVHVFLDQTIAPNFFAWSVPVDETTARVGLATTNPSSLNTGKRKLLEKMKLDDSKKIGREFNYSIPLFPRSETQKGRVMLVGDAAGQVKSTTGGGIVFGGLCGGKAAESSQAFLDGGNLDYETKWRNAYEKTFKMHWLLHSKVFSLPNFALDFAFGAAKVSGVPFVLEKAGDMDFILKN